MTSLDFRCESRAASCSCCGLSCAMVTSSVTQQHEATSSLYSAGTELPVRLAVKLSDWGPDQAEAKQKENK